MTWFWGFAITCAWLGAAVVLFITGMWTGEINSDGPRYGQCNPVSFEGRNGWLCFTDDQPLPDVKEVQT